MMSARMGNSLSARYDAAQTTDYNANIWVGVDSLSAEVANWPGVRKILRNRSRHEVANNSYAKGVQQTIVNDTVGVGPTLQMTAMGGAEDAIDSLIETEFTAWAREIRLAEKLRTLHGSTYESGECFAIQITNPALHHPVKLDLSIIESEQVAEPSVTSNVLDPLKNDGIYYDQIGNPVSYRVLRHHPGGPFGWTLPLAYDDVPARYVFHHFRKDRPGQRRGIPWITPALNTFAEVRRFTSAVLDASEWAARASALLKTPAPADGDSTDEDKPEAMSTAELPRGGAMVLPDGYDAQQMKAEQPITTYGDFLYKKLGEIGRCINFPLRLMTLDASMANLSSSYLDAQLYVRDRVIDRERLNDLLDCLLDAWLTEAIRIPGYLFDDLSSVPARFPHEWVWPRLIQHADPDKVASAESQELKNGTTTIPRVMAARGLNWEKEQAAAAKALGLTVEEYQASIRFQIYGVDVRGTASADSGGSQQPTSATNRISEMSPEGSSTNSAPA
jgi:capsid protein